MKKKTVKRKNKETVNKISKSKLSRNWAIIFKIVSQTDIPYLRQSNYMDLHSLRAEIENWLADSLVIRIWQRKTCRIVLSGRN